MTKANNLSRAVDPTLAQLWAIKDATARKYRNASEYFEFLSYMQPPHQKLASKRSMQNELMGKQ